MNLTGRGEDLTQGEDASIERYVNGRVAPITEAQWNKPVAWVWKVIEEHRWEPPEDVKRKYGIEGASIEEAAEVWRDLEAQGTVSIEEIMREHGLA